MADTKFQDDPNWRDCLLFYEYFHGDNGTGLGASHQTGWTGVMPGSCTCLPRSRPSRSRGRKKAYFEKVGWRPQPRCRRLVSAEAMSS